MTSRYRAFFFILMSLALFFGFLHHFFPVDTEYSFERLHIFLFNLCSGGTILLYYSVVKKFATFRVILFQALAICFAIAAFLLFYAVAIVISLILFVLVETTRIQKFSLFPVDFFKPSIPVSDKFHQAALLCLSVGLLISALVMWNNEYLKLISNPKLQLNMFFLGFSFPVSLITFSLMFSFMKEQPGKGFLLLKNAVFWIINLGVIFFFVFILVNIVLLQMMAAVTLFVTVITTFYLFQKIGTEGQQKTFLTSGMAFLLISAVSGIVYILLHYSSFYDATSSILLLRLHAFVSLYGWNLCGLTVITRFHDFPIRLQSQRIIVAHWITVAILAPLGYLYLPIAVGTVFLYIFVLYFIFFSKGTYRIQ